jgi:hypothetical protein
MNPKTALLGLAFIASPALADHVGPGGVGGGSINVISPDTLDSGEAAIGLRLTYGRPERRPDAELEALAGRHIHAHNTDYNLNGSLGVAYGLTHRLTVSLELPYVRRDDLREGTHSHVAGQAVSGVEALGSVAGVGDSSLLARYRLTDSPKAMFTLIAGIKAPTGSTHRRSGAGERLETEHQPGTGSWDLIAGASFGAKAGPLRLTASALYQYSGEGAQQTRLGDRAQAGLALSHRFGPPEHRHEAAGDHDQGGGGHGHTAPHGHRSWDAFVELTAEWEGRQRVAGEIEEASGGKAIWLTPGARFNSAAGFSVALAVGAPLWQRIRASHPDNDYRVTLSIGRPF